MPDFFDNQANFTNPQYASPEQLAAQRSYADALLKQSGQAVNRPTGALANLINALHGGWERNNADKIQNDAAARNSQDVSEVISQLKNGGPQTVNPETLGRIYANPMAAPEHRALASALIGQTPVKSEFGQPAQQSPIGGIQGAPINGGPPSPFTPAYRVNQGAEGVHTDAPIPAPGAPMPGAPSPTPSPPPTSGGAPGPSAALPAAPAPVAPNGVPNAPLTLDALAAKGREFAAQKAFTQGSAESNTSIAKQDIEAAANAPTIKRVAGVMLNDLQTHGNQMTFGPTAQWSNDIKRVAANYAPGFMKDQMTALASADSFDKLSAQLTSLLAKGGGTDAQLFNNMKSVPGSHNSQQGAEALLKMTLQVADQQQALRQITAGAQNAQQYEAMRNDFYKKNPIINPITGNPIALDVEKNKGASGSYEKTATNPQTGQRIGLRNGQWEPIQ